MTTLTTTPRPGRVEYRPRFAPTAEYWTEPDGTDGITVFRTHDLECAFTVATEFFADQPFKPPALDAGELVWLRRDRGRNWGRVNPGKTGIGPGRGVSSHPGGGVMTADGLCECGCGRTTNVPLTNNAKRGMFKGQPRRFISGHNPQVPPKPLLDRIIEKLEVGDCWVFMGARSAGNYGQIRRGNGASTGYAHRLLYELLVGPVDVKLDLDHLCRNRPCCNPDHLEPVTRAVNHARGTQGMAPLKAACINGHPFTVDNTVFNGGKRACRICRNRVYRKYDARRRGAA